MQVAFLGEKWSGIDYYAELLGDNDQTPVAVFQIKTTRQDVDEGTKSLHIRLERDDAQRIAKLPIPSYVLGVSEISKRVFVRAVPRDGRAGISAIPTSHELTTENLKLLHKEISDYWKSNPRDSYNSKFA